MYPHWINSILFLVSVPKIVDVSKDRTGRRALCCGKPLKLHCKAQGTPEPAYSWHFEGKPLNITPDVVLKGGTLTVRNPYVTHTSYGGRYRCVASNAWGSVLSQPIQVEVAGESLVVCINEQSLTNL
jgi:hypothetical protein